MKVEKGAGKIILVYTSYVYANNLNRNKNYNYDLYCVYESTV